LVVVTVDLYATLGVARGASRDDVRAAYRARSKAAHPDRGGSVEKFRQLVLARDVLSDEKRRARYDSTGDAEETQVDNAEAQLMQCVAQALDAAIGMAAQEGVDPVYTDLVKRARDVLRAKIEEIRKQVAGMEQRAAAFEKLARRFRRRNKAGDGPNRLRDLVEGTARTTRQAAEFNTRAADDMRRAEAFLADYEFESDKRPPDEFRPSMFVFRMGGV
jgi:curved DNA-binding protein CbpA